MQPAAWANGIKVIVCCKHSTRGSNDKHRDDTPDQPEIEYKYDARSVFHGEVACPAEASRSGQVVLNRDRRPPNALMRWWRE
jgi:hypothetical protein